MSISSIEHANARPLDVLLRHCLSLDTRVRTRAPARTRLEQALGSEFARRLVSALTS
jgi:hypothetical protein